MLIKITTAFLFYSLYWFCCFLGTGTDRKNLAGLRSYPDAVQQTVRAHKDFGKTAPKEKSIISIIVRKQAAVQDRTVFAWWKR